MLRTRLAAAAVLSLSFLPGCRLLCPDTYCNRWQECRSGGPCEAIPVSFPVANGGCPCGAPIPTGGPFVSGPIVAGPMTGGPITSGPYGAPGIGSPVYPPVYPNGGLTETLPPPYAPGPARIPKAGIDEGKGKQFELEGASRTGTGPVLAVPATGSK